MCCQCFVCEVLRQLFKTAQLSLSQKKHTHTQILPHFEASNCLVGKRLWRRRDALADKRWPRGLISWALGSLCILAKGMVCVTIAIQHIIVKLMIFLSLNQTGCECFCGEEIIKELTTANSSLIFFQQCLVDQTHHLFSEHVQGESLALTSEILEDWSPIGQHQRSPFPSHSQATTWAGKSEVS